MAVPVAQIRNLAGKIVMAGATKDVVKSMPAFNSANDTARRDAFIATADKDIEKAKADIAALEKKASTEAGDVKAELDQQVAAVKLDLKAAEDKLAAMNRAGASHWKEFEADVSAAVARLKTSLGKKAG